MSKFQFQPESLVSFDPNGGAVIGGGFYTYDTNIHNMMDKIDSNSRNDHSLLGYATYPTVIDKTKPKAFRRLHWLRVWDVNHVC